MRLAIRSAIVSALLLLGPVTAVPAQDAPVTGIQSTIRSQFDAFLRDDVTTAFTFASPNLQSLFGTPERFGQMVQNGYPMVWRPGEVRFLDQRNVAGSLWQRVMVTDQAGRVHMLDYQMVQTADGWQISAVQLLPEAGVGA